MPFNIICSLVTYFSLSLCPPQKKTLSTLIIGETSHWRFAIWWDAFDGLKTLDKRQYILQGCDECFNMSLALKWWKRSFALIFSLSQVEFGTINLSWNRNVYEYQILLIWTNAQVWYLQDFCSLTLCEDSEVPPTWHPKWVPQTMKSMEWKPRILVGSNLLGHSAKWKWSSLVSRPTWPMRNHVTFWTRSWYVHKNSSCDTNVAVWILTPDSHFAERAPCRKPLQNIPLFFGGAKEES